MDEPPTSTPMGADDYDTPEPTSASAPVTGPMGPPRRILTAAITLTPLGGIEVCTLQDSLALAARGHQMTVMYGADGEFRPAYEAAGAQLDGPYSFSFEPRHAPRDLISYLPAARRARHRRPDVVWLNRVEHLFWGQTVARWAGSPLVCHLHGPPVYPRIAQVSRGVAHFVAVSDFVREAYLERGIRPERISRIYNAIPPEDYPVGGVAERDEARQRLGLPADVPIVLCYGQMSAAKGLLTLIEAWPAVIQQHPNALLVLIDSMSDQPDARVEAALTRLAVTSYRRFPITRDVLPFLHACDVVAFPTQLPETFGRVVLEGMSTGRPVVASRVGAVPEILSGPMARFLVPPGSVEPLTAKLLEYLGWRTEQPQLASECIRWVSSHFPFGAHVDQLEQTLLQYGRQPR